MAERQDRVERAVLERRQQVDDAIPEELPIDDPARLYEASRYLLDAGGKRLRPTILLLAGEALADVEPGSRDYRAFPPAERDGGQVDLLRAAIAVEVIQSFTLIHDDIMDDDEMRRGVPAVHREFDLSTAILAGDTLYAKAFELMLDTGATAQRSVDALDRLATTCTRICEGQSMDIAYEDDPGVTTDEYLEMVERKTAVLYAASASIPAILLGHDDAVEPLYEFGLDVGRAFQIQDDLLDLTADSATLGKDRGSDLVEGKGTIVTLHARQHGVDVDGLIDADDPATVDDAAIDAAVARLEEAGSIAFARDRAHELIDSGVARLDALPDNEASQRLADVANYLVERDY